VASVEEAGLTRDVLSVADGGRFESGGRVAELLREVGYLPDSKIATVVHLGDRLGKPVLVEGPAGERWPVSDGQFRRSYRPRQDRAAIAGQASAPAAISSTTAPTISQ